MQRDAPGGGHQEAASNVRKGVIPKIKAIKDKIRHDNEKAKKITHAQILPPLTSNELTMWQREDIHYDKQETWPKKPR